jgi:hypothetical protein
MTSVNRTAPQSSSRIFSACKIISIAGNCIPFEQSAAGQAEGSSS